MQDLQEVTHEIHYENYRSDKLQPKKNNLRSNEIDTDEQQKKLIKEKDDEVTFFCQSCFHRVHLVFCLASSNARHVSENARSIS